MRLSYVSRVSWLLVAGAVVPVASCTCNEPPPEPVNRNGISEGHMPPELPPMPGPTSTSTDSAAPGASAAPPASSAAPAAATDVEWKVPQGWRFLGAPGHGPTRGHFYALETPGDDGIPEHVDVYVVQQVASKGATPEERLKDVESHEGDGFSKVESKEVTTKVVGGRTVTVVETSGVRREPVADEKLADVPGRLQVSVLLPETPFPVRVAMHGRRELVERCRGAFFEFVDSVRVKSR